MLGIVEVMKGNNEKDGDAPSAIQLRNAPRGGIRVCHETFCSFAIVIQCSLREALFRSRESSQKCE